MLMILTPHQRCCGTGTYLSITPYSLRSSQLHDLDNNTACEGTDSHRFRDGHIGTLGFFRHGGQHACRAINIGTLNQSEDPLLRRKPIRSCHAKRHAGYIPFRQASRRPYP